MKVAGGLKEDGITIGNAYDKYGSKNPIVRWIMNGFHNSLSVLVNKASPESIHEIGCGEGYWVVKWKKQGIDARGTDFSAQVIELARKNSIENNITPDIFRQRSIYDITPENDSADLVVCCEVMEHLQSPEEALKVLQKVVDGYIILSVPQEPIWCALNLLRGKYISSFGNTPGHIQHWSRKKFIELVAQYFDIVEIKTPFPWTMILCKRKQIYN